MGFDHVIPQLYQRALQGQDPLDVYSAEHTRAFCHIDDALEATVAAMDRPEAEGLTINVGNDREEVRIIELAGRLLQAAGLQAALRPVPAPHDPITRRCPDMGLAERVLGYRPRVDLDRGLAMTLPWYEQRLEAWAEMDGGG
jgi:UDP-glucose 4-epimerase/UDP-glucuronate decarboxylase